MSHSHGGGCCDHGPQTTGMGGPPGGGGGGPPQMNIQIDERMQLLLDSLPTRNVPFTLVDVPLPGSQPPQTQQMVVCAEHKAPVCETCSVNFTPLNYMHQFMRSAPPEAIPPPPQVQPPPHRAEAIKQAKEAGNVRLDPLSYVELTSRTLSSRETSLVLSRTTPDQPTWRSHGHLGSLRPSRATRLPLLSATALLLLPLRVPCKFCQCRR